MGTSNPQVTGRREPELTAASGIPARKVPVASFHQQQKRR
jgi:hypothetical protein